MRRSWLIGGLIGMLTLALSATAAAQEVRVSPGQHALPNDLTAYMKFLAGQQIESLRLFSEYMQQRAEDKQVPRGLYLNAKAMQLQAELASAQDPMVKKELLTEMAKLYDQRVQLDAGSPQQTWYGVDRTKLGQYMKREYQLFQQQAAEPNKKKSAAEK